MVDEEESRIYFWKDKDVLGFLELEVLFGERGGYGYDGFLVKGTLCFVFFFFVLGLFL